jgi:predicted Fe-Mo cluster-binding NifX family protein
MKIMIPLHAGLLTPHFGHCQEFGLLDLDRENGEVITSERLNPPMHEPGVLPRWIADQGADLVIAGGMGQKARQILEQRGVQVVTGAPSEAPEQVVLKWHRGEISGDSNLCDH